MKGIMFVARGQAALTDEPMPECAPGTLLCQTTFSGLTNGAERATLMGGN